MSRRILPAAPEDVKRAPVPAGAARRWPGAEALTGAVGEARRHQRRELRKEAILEVAAPLFVHQGFSNTSLDDVAGALGLTRPAVYHYFRDKNQILLAIVERAFANLIGEARVVARSQCGSLEKLERIFTLHTTRVAADPQAIFLIVTQAAELSTTAQASLKRRQRAYENLLLGLVEQGMADGEIAPGPAGLVVKAMVSLANWVYTWYDPRGRQRPDDVAGFYWALLRGGLVHPA
jgi:AcrR family transcriptional regulator